MIHFITLDFAIHVQNQLIEEYGGRKGIRDLGLLKSALDMPKAAIKSRYLHRTIFDKAAAYLFHISRNHPFIDGNKRTAAMVSMIFLSSNDVALAFQDDEFEKIVLLAAQGKATKKEISKFFLHANKAAKTSY